VLEGGRHVFRESWIFVFYDPEFLNSIHHNPKMIVKSSTLKYILKAFQKISKIKSLR
jgi:hypothetical protein